MYFKFYKIPIYLYGILYFDVLCGTCRPHPWSRCSTHGTCAVHMVLAEKM